MAWQALLTIFSGAVSLLPTRRIRSLDEVLSAERMHPHTIIRPRASMNSRI